MWKVIRLIRCISVFIFIQFIGQTVLMLNLQMALFFQPILECPCPNLKILCVFYYCWLFVCVSWNVDLEKPNILITLLQCIIYDNFVPFANIKDDRMNLNVAVLVLMVKKLKTLRLITWQTECRYYKTRSRLK